jgi:hypothetical protein
MRIILFLLSVLAFLAGSGVLVGAESAIHEIEAFMLYLISAIFLSGAAVVEAINAARKKLEPVISALAVPKPPEVVRPVQTTPAPPPPSPAPAPKPVQRSYFVSIDGKDSGPHSLDEVRKLRQIGKLTDETLVIRQGDSEWQAASMFPEICF